MSFTMIIGSSQHEWTPGLNFWAFGDQHYWDGGQGKPNESQQTASQP
jgi:hypothetical protein